MNRSDEESYPPYKKAESDETSETASSNHDFFDLLPIVLFWTFVFTGLYLASLYNYTLFHNLAEGFSIFVGLTAFILIWNSRDLLSRDYLLFIGIMYLFVALLDLVHTMAYPGLSIFIIPENIDAGAAAVKAYQTNLSSQLWIAARYLESFSLLLVPLFMKRKLRGRNLLMVLMGYIIITFVILVSIFYGVFPDTFIYGSGLTSFKVASEYVISAILLCGVAIFYKIRSSFDDRVFKLITSAMLLTVGSEMAFTLYSDAYGHTNLIGHFLKIISFYLVYRAVVVIGVKRPQDVLYRKLKRSEKKQRQLLEQMPYGFALHEIVFDDDEEPTDFIFLKVNEAYQRLTGLKKEDIIGRKVTEVLPNIKADPANWIERYGRVVLTGETEAFEDYSENLDRWYSVLAYKTKTGKFAVIIDDITERKIHEKKLKTANKKIRRQEKLATIGTLAGGLAHDLRNPLASLKNAVYLLKMSNPDPEEDVKETLDIMESELSASEKKIEKLLDFARPKSLHRESTDVNKVLNTALSKVYVPEEIDIKISSSEEVEIQADANQLTSIFTNIIQNAIQSMSDGGKLEITCRPTIEPDGVEIIFEDTGEGISHEEMDKLFDPLFTTKSKGTGLGLAITKIMVDMHGGDLKVKSEVGEGSTFTLNLPKDGQPSRPVE